MSFDGFFRTLKGWLAACGAATAAICAILIAIMAIAPGGLLRGSVLVLLFIAVVVFIATSILTAIPAAFVIGLSERLRIRSVVFYGCAGGAIGALSQALLFMSFTSFNALSWLFVFAGCVAGIDYWYVAGQHAGRNCRCA